MIGRVLGKVAGELIALPVTVASETLEAVDEAKQTEKVLDRAFEPPKEKKK